MPEVKKFDIEKIREDIKKLRFFIKEIEQIGGEMPGLKTALDRLEVAVNTGADLAAAATDTSVALNQYTQELYRVCPKDDDQRFVCMAQIDRKWQARNVEWVLSFDKRESTVRGFLRRTLQRYLPAEICARLDDCAGKTASTTSL